MLEGSTEGPLIQLYSSYYIKLRLPRGQHQKYQIHILMNGSTVEPMGKSN